MATQVLFREPFQLACAQGNPLATKKRLALEDLREEKLLLLEDGHCLRDQALEVCAQAGATEQGGFRASSLETLRQMVAIGQGITLIPELAVQRELSPHHLLRYLPFAEPAPHRLIGLVWRQGSHREPLFRACGEVIQKQAELALVRPSLPPTPPGKRSRKPEN